MALPARDLLELWERAQSLPPVQRTLALATAAAPDGPGAPWTAQALADAPLGACHAALLRLRADVIGPTLEALATCPGCGQDVELTLDVLALAALGTATAAQQELRVDGWSLRWRSATWGDLAAAAQAAEHGEDPEQVLLSRTVLVTREDGTEVARPPDDLPAAVRSRLAAAMAGADPLAEVLVAVACPACGLEFDSDVDVASFVWTELRARARRVLAEVDTLARAYGWSEADVLALGEARRAAYLRLVIEGSP